MSVRNQVRIIGGQWRGRKVSFPDMAELRPTSDRVRETLFNWLQTDVVGAKCLDLFAGSGALGLEALSRGAEEVIFIDSQNKVVEYIRAALETLEGNGHAICTYVKQFCRNYPPQPFDIIFLDPPFNKNHLDKTAAVLNDPQWIREGGLIYVEHERDLHWTAPSRWQLLKRKEAGSVCFSLYRYTS